MFAYIPLSYPQYAASLFAGNDFLRSSFAFGSVLFSRAMYLNLGVAKGVSLLGGLSVLGIVSRRSVISSFPTFKTNIGLDYLYFHGAKLRARSKLRKKNPLSSLPFFA